MIKLKIFSNIILSMAAIFSVFFNTELSAVDDHYKLYYSEEYYLSSENISTYCLNIYFTNNDSTLSSNLDHLNLLNHNCKQVDLKIHGLKRYFIDVNYNHIYSGRIFYNLLEYYLIKNNQVNANVEIFNMYFYSSEVNTQAEFDGIIFTSFPNVKKIRLIGDSIYPSIFLNDSMYPPLMQLESFTMDNLMFNNDYLPNYLKPPHGFNLFDVSFNSMEQLVLPVTLNKRACLTIRVNSLTNLNLIISEGFDQKHELNFNDLNYESIKVLGQDLKNVNIVFVSSFTKRIIVKSLVLFNSNEYIKSFQVSHPDDLDVKNLFVKIKRMKMPHINYSNLNRIKKNSNLHEKAYSRCWF